MKRFGGGKSKRPKRNTAEEPPHRNYVADGAATNGGLLDSESSGSIVGCLSINGVSTFGGSIGGGATDYDDQADIVRFLEDGSFIGQYGGWPKQARKASRAASSSRNSMGDGGASEVKVLSTSTTALSTFV